MISGAATKGLTAFPARIPTAGGRKVIILATGTGILLSLTGCIGDMPHAGSWNSAREPAPVGAAPFAVDEYVYFPRYAIYYNRTRNRYVSLESDGWATRTEPAGITMETLQDSPSVPLSFHDAPSLHHDEVVRNYPRNWPASGVAVVGRSGD